MNEELLEHINSYYSLKQKYDEKYTKAKKKFLNNDMLTTKEKKDGVKDIKMKCVNCNREVGTIFSIEDGILKAKCGSNDAPCDLNIEINRGKFVNKELVYKEYLDAVNDGKERIIKTKLDLLFNFKTESEVLKEFEELKKELKEDVDMMLKFRKELLEITYNLENKDNINENMESLYDNINTFKKNIQNYEETNKVQFIKDAVEIYKNEMLPLLMKHRELQYKTMNIEYNENDKTFHLIQKKFYDENMEQVFDDPAVISVNMK